MQDDGRGFIRGLRSMFWIYVIAAVIIVLVKVV